MDLPTRLIILEIPGLVFAAILWLRGRGSTWTKLFWSFILIVPVFGIILYLVLYDAPASQEEGLRAHRTRDDDTLL